jgi:GTP cyclohydrolase I
VSPSADEFDSSKVEEGVRLILEGIGEDPGREGLKETPRRVADMYREVFSGLHQDPEAVVDVTFDAAHDEMIMVRDITLQSLCAPHRDRRPGSRGVHPRHGRADHRPLQAGAPG